MKLTALLLLLLTANTMAAMSEDETKQPATPEARLIEVIKQNLHTPEPSANTVRRASGESLFDGSYDWHSNLFAHWVLLRHAREQADEALAAWVLEPLTEAALAAERKRLAQVETERLVTYPYDQAWLLLLLAELALHRQVSSATREFRLEVETRLIDWLERSKFPENDNPDVLDGRGIVGWYRSWAFTWYQVRRSQPIGEGAVARLESLGQQRLTPQLESMLTPVEPFPFEFIWVPSLAYLIHDIAPFEPAPPAYDLGQLPALPESVKLSTTHLLGVHLTRLWPLAIAARTDERARARLDELVAAYMERHDLWRGDFQVISHWIPQFLWFTLWLAEERA